MFFWVLLLILIFRFISNQHNTKLQNKIKRKIKINRSTQKNITGDRTKKKKWAIFQYHSPATRKIKNLFQSTDIQFIFKTPNTTYKLLQGNQQTEQYESDGLYGIKCSACNQWYIGRSLNTRHKEHISYIRQNQISAYAMHILNNNHEYGPITEPMRLLKNCKKSTTMNCWEDLFIHQYKEDNKLIRE
jgi:hypothetical protein